MDYATFLIQAVFAVVFAWAVRAWLRRRDILSLDVVLVFLPMTALSIVGLIRVAAGSVPPVVSAVSVILLLAQPVFTLRLASRIAAAPLAILAAGGGTAGGAVREVTAALARFAALLAAVGYLAAFLPPAFLRRTWQATTAYRGLRDLLAIEDQEPARLWRTFPRIARDATRVVIVSASVLSQERANTLAVADEFPPKPFVTCDLIDLTARCVPRAAAWTERGQPA